MRLVPIAILACALAGDVVADCAPCSNPVVKWQWDVATRSPSTPYACTPILVVQLTDDNADGLIDCADDSDVLLLPFSYNFLHEGRIVALDGATGATLFTIDTAPALDAATFAAADIDGDGIVEILAATNTGDLVAFEHDGTPKWTMPTGFGGPYMPIGVADLDQDGAPEIYRSNTVHEWDGTPRFTGSDGRGAISWLHVSHAVDLVPSSPGLELLAGNTAYRPNGSIAWLAPVDDGLSAVGDLDGDGLPEVVVVHALSGLSVLDGATGAVRWASPPSYHAMQPAMGDVDGDGRDDVIVPEGNVLRVLKWTGGALVTLWSVPTQDISTANGASLFDFDGNGALDVVYHDENEWYIFDGPTGTLVHSASSQSLTGMETPVIVDLDHDGITEILISRCGWSSGDLGGLVVYECPDSATARAVWNQYSYHVTNVSCDGTVPTVESAPWPQHQGWLAQQAEGGDCDAGPDVTASCDGIQLHGEPGCGSGALVHWTSSCPGTTFAPSADVLDPFVLLGGSCAQTCTLTMTAGACADSLVATVDDDAAPTLSGVPADAIADCGAVPLPATSVTASDSCDPAPALALVERRIDGACAGSYQLTRTWTATDACGNFTSASQRIDVSDTAPPAITVSDALVGSLWPPNHRMRCFGPGDFAPVIQDDCSGPVTWSFDSCASDQPDDDLGDGAFEPDCVIDGDLVCVRAERMGTRREGRTYAVFIRATDACGNTSAPGRIGTIHVPHDRRRPGR